MRRETEIEIAPEPPDEVREAIVAALEQLDDDRRESPWWRAGVVESVASELE